MRKKSHVSLSRYLLDHIDSELLENHRKAFIVGSVLPDCKPSFVTTKHNMEEDMYRYHLNGPYTSHMEETFDMVCEFIRKLTVNSDDYKKISTAYCRKLGEVTHYLADYFTFPHNCVFTGSIREHCIYEKKLKFALRSYIRSGEINVNSTVVRRFTTPQQLCDYVIQIHQQYLKCNKTVESDCRYIVALCHVAVAGILNLLEHYRNSNPVSAAAAA